MLRKVQEIVKVRNELFGLLRARGFFKNMAPTETECNYFERVFLAQNGAVQLPIKSKRAAQLMARLMHLIHETTPHLGKIVGCVLSHYYKKIHFSYSDIGNVFDDLKSECYIGIVRGLLRVSEDYADDYNKVYRYIMKVARSHIKSVLSVLLLSARVPQSRWMSLSAQEKNNLVPISLNGMNEQHREDNGNGGDGNNSVAVDNFPLADVEFADFVARLPQPYKMCVRAVMNGDSLEFPYLQKMFALYALVLYKTLS